MLKQFKNSVNFLSQNSDNTPQEDLILGETHYFFKNRSDYLSYFKEERRALKEIITQNDISMSKRNNNILNRDSIFYNKNFVQQYIIEKYFDINQPLCSFENNTLKFINYYKSITTSTISNINGTDLKRSNIHLNEIIINNKRQKFDLLNDEETKGD